MRWWLCHYFYPHLQDGRHNAFARQLAICWSFARISPWGPAFSFWIAWIRLSQSCRSSIIRASAASFSSMTAYLIDNFSACYFLFRASFFLQPLGDSHQIFELVVKPHHKPIPHIFLWLEERIFPKVCRDLKKASLNLFHLWMALASSNPVLLIPYWDICPSKHFFIAVSEFYYNGSCSMDVHHICLLLQASFPHPQQEQCHITCVLVHVYFESNLCATHLFSVFAVDDFEVLLHL